MRTFFTRLAMLLVAALGVCPAVAGSRESAASATGDLVGDALLDFRVRAALLESIGPEGLDVTIASEGGNVRLVGVVSSPDVRKLALSAAGHVRGVRSLDDRLQVGAVAVPVRNDEPPHPGRTPQSTNDALLEARVKARLLEALGIRALRLEIEAQSGTITVAGSVPTKDEREMAVQVAREVLGVEFVEDLVRVDRALRKVLVETAETRRRSAG